MTKFITTILFVASLAFASDIDCSETKSVTFDFMTNKMTPVEEKVETGNRYYSHTYTGRDNRLVEFSVCQPSSDPKAKLINELISSEVKRYDGKAQCESKNIKVTAEYEAPLASIRVSVFPLDSFFSYSRTYFLTKDDKAIKVEIDIDKERFENELEEIVEQEAFRTKPRLKTAKKQDYYKYAYITIRDHKLYIGYNGYQLDFQGGGAFEIEIPFEEWMLKNRDELSESDMRELKNYFECESCED